jgi:hypothetical protein
MAAGALTASAAAGGFASAAVRTSLGRIVGTYEATPAEQAWDIGFETLLNTAGVKIIAGVKPSAKWVAGRLDKVHQAFKDTIPGVAGVEAAAKGAFIDMPKNVLKKIFAGYSVGIDNFDTFLENPNATKGMMNALHSKAGQNVAAYHDEGTRMQLKMIANIAENARGSLTKIYGAMRNKLLSEVPEDFAANLDKPIFSAYSDAISKGFGKIVVRTPDRVSVGARDYLTGQLTQTVTKGGTKELVGDEAIEYLAKNGTKGVRFQLLSKQELANKLSNGDISGPGEMVVDDAAYAALDNFYKQIGQFAGGANRTGRKGAQALLDFKKISTDLSYQLAQQENVKSSFVFKQVIDQARHTMDKSVRAELQRAGVSKNFDKLNSTYARLSDQFAPLLKAHAKAQTEMDYQPLLSTFLSRPGKSVGARFAVDDLIDTANEYGLKEVSEEVSKGKLNIQIVEAAKAFNPLKPGQLKADGLGATQAGVLSYAALSANPALLGAAIGMQVLRSPRTARGAVVTTNALYQGQQMLSGMTEKQLNAFLSKPQAINSFVTGITSSPLVYMKAEGELNQLIEGARQQQLQMQQQQMQPGPGMSGGQ